MFADIGYVYMLTHEYTAVQPSDALDFSTYQASGNTLILNINREFILANISNSGSMHPTVSDNSQAIEIKPIKAEIYVGDIIVYVCNDVKIMHRVVKIENGIYTTKGDNNFNADSCTPTFEDIKWKVVGIIY